VSQPLPRAIQAALTVLAEENPEGLRDFVDTLVPPKNLTPAGGALASTAAASDTAVAIPADYKVGEKYDLGVYLGQFDLGNGVGEKPIFVVELTKEAKTFCQTVAAAGDLADGYVADPWTYDAKQGLREGKTVIAPFDMLKAAYKDKNIGEFKNMFKKAGWILSSSTHPGDPDGVRFVDFRDGGCGWRGKGRYRAPSLPVRTALTL
jgi:hypothetical protein